jgi:hypothetical protein
MLPLPATVTSQDTEMVPLPVAVALIVQVLLAKLAVTEMFAVTLESILGLAVALSLQLMKW